ncbi:MAG: UbiH/UbiF/VisC/COQ6 family ubiquinone biosynthesis hydroxylase [Pseudomonadota bacterium]
MQKKPPSDHRYDVAIIGGGLIGCAMALALSREGFSTALLDPAPTDARTAADFDGRAYAIAEGSSNLLRALGVWDQVAPNAQPVRSITVTDRTKGPVSPALIHFDPEDRDITDLGHILEDRFLRSALLEAVDQSDVVHLSGVGAANVDVGPGWARIDDRISARLVVCCDGRRSAVARAAGIRYLAWSYGQTGLVSAVAHEHPHGGEAHQAFFPGGPFAVLPLTENRSSLVWSEQNTVAAEIAGSDDQTYMAEITSRIAGRLGALDLAGKRWSYPLGLSLALDYCAPRLVVAGDAAHGVHPIAGQGMNLGLRDVAALTEILTEAARRGEDIGAQMVLERYQEWRRPDATVMALGMDGLNRLFSTGSGPIQAVRNLGLGAVAASDPARRLFASMASGTVAGAPKLLKGR